MNSPPDLLSSVNHFGDILIYNSVSSFGSHFCGNTLWLQFHQLSPWTKRMQRPSVPMVSLVRRVFHQGTTRTIDESQCTSQDYNTKLLRSPLRASSQSSNMTKTPPGEREHYEGEGCITESLSIST
ncbi:hypothetical protein Tco_0011695 [Tanacetum coccineum]